MHVVDADDKTKDNFLEQELTEEKFFEEFATLEESLAHLQLHVREMSENAKRFSRLAMHIRRSVCPAALAQDRARPAATCVARDP